MTNDDGWKTDLFAIHQQALEQLPSDWLKTWLFPNFKKNTIFLAKEAVQEHTKHVILVNC